MIETVYLIGILPAAYCISGMVFSEFQFIWWEYPSRARKDRRSDAVAAILAGLVFATWWPIALFAAYYMTGFAEHGIWRSPR